MTSTWLARGIGVTTPPDPLSPWAIEVAQANLDMTGGGRRTWEFDGGLMESVGLRVRARRRKMVSPRYGSLRN